MAKARDDYGYSRTRITRTKLYDPGGRVGIASPVTPTVHAPAKETGLRRSRQMATDRASLARDKIEPVRAPAKDPAVTSGFLGYDRSYLQVQAPRDSRDPTDSSYRPPKLVTPTRQDRPSRRPYVSTVKAPQVLTSSPPPKRGVNPALKYDIPANPGFTRPRSTLKKDSYDR